MKTLILGVCLFLPGAAIAQPGVLPSAPRPAAPQQPAPLPPLDPLFRRDEANRVVRIDGVLEGLAILRNPLIDEAARQRLMPLIQDWTADVNQLAIDNLDFLEKIDAGFLDNLDPMDVQKMKTVQSMISSQLSQAGSLSARLSQRQAIDMRQMQVCMQLASEYVQAVAMELSAQSTPVPQNDPVAQQARQQAVSRAINLWYQSNSARDVREQYRRILVDSALLLDRVLPALALPSDGSAKLAPKIGAVKAAKNDLEKLLAVRALLDELTFDQRRAFLAKAVELGAAADPFNPAPSFPARPALDTHAAAAPAPAPASGQAK